MKPSDCYQILGVQKGASQKEIKNAYRQLSLKYHPDRNNTHKDGEKFKQVTEAYQLLRREEKSRTKTSETDVSSNYTQFWKKYDGSTMNDNFNFGPNFAGFKNPFGASTQENYDHFREKESSFKSTHMILYGGLGIIALWIILESILK
ncbi:MAG TPA: DnaJ domain-containing protein [Candidatus Nitrosotalea sp.]|nr:DnaJ domain-containing protein [Nitrososphaerota archaeon]HKU32302.1 DnaJ domain-containing protein [Candidatus Nitrosotalea sp.]